MSGSIFDDLDAIRTSPGTGPGAVTELLATVQVRKPRKDEFVRTRPEPAMAITTAVYRDETTIGRETYFVYPSMRGEMLGLTTDVTLTVTITRQGVLLLWPVPALQEGRFNNWTLSARRAALEAQSRWVRMAANSALGAYDVQIAGADLPDPEWPDKTLSELLEVAFQGRIIDSIDHPIVKRLRGLI